MGKDKDASLQLERELMTKCDYVIVSSERLYQKKKPYNKKTFLVTNGVDVVHFRKACDPQTSIPEEMKRLPRPLIGFFGLIADWIDFDLIRFYDDRAIYRDSRRKLEVLFDQASLPLLWDSSWNQWKHLLGTKIGVKATFIQSGKYQHRAGAWNLAQWETALPSRIEVALPSNIAEQIADARKSHHRFGEYSEALDLIRARIEVAPVERADLQKLCAGLGMPGDFDVALITWKPDYDAFYYKQLCKRARERTAYKSKVPNVNHETTNWRKET